MVMRRILPVCLLLLTGAAPEAPSRLPPSVALHHIAPAQAMAVLGHRVIGPDGKVIARLVNVLVDAKGQPVAAVLDFGGFMGVGSRKIAVHWGALRFAPAQATDRITLLMTADEIKAAPEYKDTSKPAPVVAPTGAPQKPDSK